MTPGYELHLETSFLKIPIGGTTWSWSTGQLISLLLTRAINAYLLFLCCQQPLTFLLGLSQISHGEMQGEQLLFPKVQKFEMSQELNSLQCTVLACLLQE